MSDEYALIKGKALTLVREFQKVYPKADEFDIYDRIENEVWYAAHIIIPNTREIQTAELHRIIQELKQTTI